MTPIEGRNQAMLLAEYCGINPYTIALEGITEEGYYCFEIDGDGRLRWTTNDSGETEVLKLFTPWPNSFPVKRFFELIDPWRKANGVDLD